MLRYIKRNQERLTQAFGSGMFKGISFYSKDEKSFWSPFYLSLVTEDILSLRDIGMGRGDEIIYGTALMRCRLNSLKKHTTELCISKQFLLDIKSIVNTGYGIVTAMQEGKYPHDYFRNSASSLYLTPDESKEIEMWRRKGHRFQTMVRNIYWGNVLSRSHWRNNKAKEKYLLTGLQHECGDNVIWIDNNTLFFCAPYDILDYEQDESKKEQFQNNIRSILKDCDIDVLT
jgi:hypothetical protein